MVVPYPILKSKRDCSLVIVGSNFFFSTTQTECQMEISKGAGIQPIKAIKKAIEIESEGIICLKSIITAGFIASATAIIVLTVRPNTIIFINESSILYLPIIKINIHIPVIITAQKINELPPKREDAIPAVTMVTAVCIVNIEANVIRI